MKINFLKKKWKLISSAIFLVIIGVIIGFLSYNFLFNCNTSGFKYINSDLICKNNLVVGKHSYSVLKNKLETYIEGKKKDNTVVDVSIYFRDLQNGPTLGINEHELFSPASLLKLPLLLTYNNLQNDEIPDLFDREIIAETAKYIPEQRIVPKKSIILGQSYSIKTLLEYMIKYSDNTAYYVLLDYLYLISPSRDSLKDTFVDLGIIDPKDFLDNTISVKSYGSIFIQLYNSSYFNQKKISDEVLHVLAQVDWKEGINGGLPDGVVAAHKFGERFYSDKNLDQLHDCGVVYYPNSPYLLCVMTRGEDIEQLSSIIRDISEMVYDEFDSRKL